MSTNKDNSKQLTLKSVRSLISKVAAVKVTKSARKKKGKTGKKPRAGMSPALVGYARMLQDPCAAPLGPGLYGTGNGYALRFHNTFAADAAAPSTATNSGFFLFCPNYHCEGGSTTAAGTTSAVNLLIGSAASSASLIPLSGVTGGATVLPLSYAPPDPAFNFMDSGTPQDSRCVGACVRVGFEQNLTKMQGRVAYLDLPQNIIDESLASGISVDQLFSLSRKVERVKLTQSEIRWKPGPADALFRAPCHKAVVASDDPTYRYSAGVYALSNGKYETSENRWIGFAYLGIDSGTTSQVRYDVYKNIEWRPRQGLGMALPNEGREAAVAPVKLVESYLPDGWQTGDVFNAAMKGARFVAEAATAFAEFAYIPNMAARYSTPALMGH